MKFLDLVEDDSFKFLIFLHEQYVKCKRRYEILTKNRDLKINIILYSNIESEFNLLDEEHELLKLKFNEVNLKKLDAAIIEELNRSLDKFTRHINSFSLRYNIDTYLDEDLPF